MLFVVVKRKSAYEMRISDWSSDGCSSELAPRGRFARGQARPGRLCRSPGCSPAHEESTGPAPAFRNIWTDRLLCQPRSRSQSQAEARRIIFSQAGGDWRPKPCCRRSEEHTSELQSLMRIPYAVFRL